MPSSTYTATHEWDDIGSPVVVNHGSDAHLYRAASHYGGVPGFCLSFTLKDIPVVEELLLELRKIETAEAEAEDNATQ